MGPVKYSPPKVGHAAERKPPKWQKLQESSPIFSCNSERNNASACKYLGATFLGISLTRYTGSSWENKKTVTRQNNMNLDSIQDRQGKWVCHLNDDGWLVGGGETYESTKLAGPDSAHISIMELGILNPELGGISFDDLNSRLANFQFSPLKLKPTSYGFNPDNTELEIQWEMHPTTEKDLERLNQLFEDVPCAFQPDHWHCSVARGPHFCERSSIDEYFSTANKILDSWNIKEPIVLDCPTCTISGGFYLYKNREQILQYYSPTRLDEINPN